MRQGFLRGSIKNKLIMILLIFGFLPLLVQSVVTYRVVNQELQEKVDSLAAKSIDSLTLNVANDIQSLLDLAYFFSRNKNIIGILDETPGHLEINRQLYERMRNEIVTDSITNRVNYVFQYCIIDWDGVLYTNSTYIPNEYQTADNFHQLISPEWIQGLKEDIANRTVLISERTQLLPMSGRQICAAANVISSGKSVGAVLFMMDSDIVSKNLNNAKAGERSSIYIVDEEGRCFVDGRRNKIPFEALSRSFIDSLGDTLKSGEAARVGDREQLVVYRDLRFRGIDDLMKVLVLMEKEEFYQDLDRLNGISLWLALASLLALAVIALLAERYLITPIAALYRLMQKVQEGNLEVHAAVRGRDEIGILARGFNVMVTRLKEQMQEIHQKEEIKRQLEFQMLQSQIRPHFVRNTLNVIRWMAEMNGAGGVCKAILTFTRMLEYNFRDSSSIATVKEEMDYVQDYLYLQKLRFHNRFMSRLDITENILSCKIPKFTFQPIVENSVVHGFAGKKGLGSIEITGREEGDCLVFTVRDDGVGMDEGALASLRDSLDRPVADTEHDHIALPNVHARIRMNFGSGYGIHVDSRMEEGTLVTVRLPIVKS